MDDNRTVWCGNLSQKVTEEVLYELFLQAGPLERVKIPKDNQGRQRTFGFITFKHECSVPYSIALFEGTSLFNNSIILKSRNGTHIDIPQGQASVNNIHSSGRQRTRSLPINFGNTADYNMLLQLGNQMLSPGSFGGEQVQFNQYCNGNLPLYRSQMNNSYYLGGDLEQMPTTNRFNYGNNRHQPYALGDGSRGPENGHNSNSHHSSKKSGHHRHDHRHSSRRRHH